MKKKIAIAITVVLVIALLPIPIKFKDGGTVKYQAVLYSISDVHRLSSLENNIGFEEGIIVEILGTEVFNTVTTSTNEDDPAEEYDLIPMVMVDGVLYLDTGHNNTEIRKCGTPDGKITSQVKGNKKPTQNNQSNFGTGYGYQYGTTEGTIEIYMNGIWRIFATEDVRQEIQFGNNPSNQVFDVILSFANTPKTNKIYRYTLNRDKLSDSNVRHLPIYKFDTFNELEKFKTDFADEFTMNNGWDEIPSFDKSIAKYDDNFFEENSLILVYIDSPNSTHRFGLDSISWDDKSLSVFINETTNAEFVDCAMSGWFLTIAVSSESIANCTEYDAVLNNGFKLVGKS